MRRLKKPGLALVLGFMVGVASSTTGCATLTGLTTGAFTGAVDAPAEVYRYHRGEFERDPMFWAFDVMFFVPLGFAAGPLVGAGKGLALDTEWLVNKIGYGPVFGTYNEPSIWRPYTIHW
jgi:hypothetical protein